MDGALTGTNRDAGDVPGCSIVIPCYNEEASIEATLAVLADALRPLPEHELIVVNDGSADRTAAILAELAPRFPQLTVIDHPLNRGYGAALKTGIRAARYPLIAITDADGTYPNERLPELIARCAKIDMVVGSRTGPGVVYSKLRAFPKFFLKRWVSFIAGRPVPDINSGMRVFRKDVAEQFLNVLPNSFSFTITITLAMLTTFRNVVFVPISYAARQGKSHIKPFSDTWRFIKLILRTGVYFAPVRAFSPLLIALGLATLASLGYDLFVLDDLTEKTLLLALFTMNTGMFVLIADMIDKRTGGR